MKTSSTTKELTLALLAFQKKAITVGKDSTNPHFKARYASLANIQEDIVRPLGDCELCYTQFPDGPGLTTRLMHSSGEWMQATVTMQPVQNTPQAHGSAITYAKRYALVAILGLRIDGDDDGQAASAPAPAALINQAVVASARKHLAAARSVVELKEIWESLEPAEQSVLKADATAARSRIAHEVLQAATSKV